VATGKRDSNGLGDAPSGADAEERRELERLKTPPTGPKPKPQVATAMQELPMGELAWQDFEKLCERLVELEGNPERVARYGTPGQDQLGIDIYSRLGPDDYAVYQCKRHKEVQPSTIKNAIDEFLKHKWARTARTFVLCTSAPLDASRLADEIERHSKRLARRKQPIRLLTWDQIKLSRELKAHPRIVEDFFGRAILELFLPGEATDSAVAAIAEVSAKVDRFMETTSLSQRVVVTTLDWAPEALKTVLSGIAREDHETFVRLTDLVGEPPSTDAVLSNIASPAMWLQAAAAEPWNALALMAEQAGQWRPAVDAWQEASGRARTHYEAAGLLVSAAAAASVAGDDGRKEEFLASAERRCAEHPRLRLELARDLPPEPQLNALEGVEGRDNIERAMLAAQRALAYLLIPDMEHAAAHAEKAGDAARESVAAQSVAINVAVYRARLAVLDAMPFAAEPLRQAHRDALTLRDRLLKQKRYEESGRLLMLAADALSLQGDFTAAQELLGQARPGELGARDIADVLGNAAQRALDPRLALKLTDKARKSQAGIRRIRATATLELHANAAERRKAVKTLERLMAAEDPESDEAAFALLDDALGHGDWSPKAEQRLASGRHQRAAIMLRAMWLGHKKANWEDAYELFEPHLDHRWALVGRLRIATSWGKHSVMVEAADAMMAAGPSQPVKIECGRAYMRAGKPDRAHEVLIQVANDDTTSSLTRAEAYAHLVRIAGPIRHDWRKADKLHKAWIKVRPGDTRASALAPTIAARLTT
jgi:hypothetical protein